MIAVSVLAHGSVLPIANVINALKFFQVNKWNLNIFTCGFPRAKWKKVSHFVSLECLSPVPYPVVVAKNKASPILLMRHAGEIWGHNHPGITPLQFMPGQGLYSRNRMNTLVFWATIGEQQTWPEEGEKRHHDCLQSCFLFPFICF